MNRVLSIPAAFALVVIAFAFPPDLAAAGSKHCRVKAIKDVYLEVYYSRGHRKASSIRHKNEVMWSGTLSRGGIVPITAPSGWVHLTFEDLTQDDPRMENDDTICQGGNVILVPR